MSDTTVPVFQLPPSNTLLILSDVHIGANEHKKDEFKQAIKWAKKVDAAIHLNGDIAENAIVSGKSAGEKLLGQCMNPNDQLDEIVDTFESFADRGRLVGITRGNHEGRSRREAMIDLCQILSKRLKVPYFQVGGYIKFKTSGSQNYIGAIQHGNSGAASLSQLMKMRNIYPLADFVALGHNHDLFHVQEHTVSIKNGKSVAKNMHLIRTGSYYGYADYTKEGANPPRSVGSPILKFDPDEHKVIVDIQTLNWPPF